MVNNFKLKVLSLNCWAIFVPFACKLRKERISAIGDYLSKCNCDIISLQEIWSNKDYAYLEEKLADTFPYSHYFYSGHIGSGVCMFSKYEIMDTHHYAYTLNGYAHRIFQGDWYGGKLVGLAKICVNDLKINFYATHMHAQYNNSDQHYDAYSHHRTLQSFEMSRYVSLTSGNADLVIIAGDINHRPNQLGYRMLMSLCQLEDAWPEDIATCDRPDNSFSIPSNKFPDGVKLDYIFFRPGKGVKVSVVESGLEMRRVPGKDYNFSDHEGVQVTFNVEKIQNEIEIPCSKDRTVRRDILNETKLTLERGYKLVGYCQSFYFVVSCVALFILLALHSQNFVGHRVNRSIASGHLGITGPTKSERSRFDHKSVGRPESEDDSRCVFWCALNALSQIVLILLAAFSFWHGFVVLKCEKNVLKSANSDVEILLKGIGVGMSNSKSE